jgi:4'-phosphopantetheinyl transferase
LNTIFPVLLAVPDHAKSLKGREKVMFLSRHARKALTLSAEYKGLAIFSFPKDGNGVPFPFQGHFWSVTHKPLYVGGIVAPEKIGIDIEKIRTCSDGLFEKTAHDSEWNLSDHPRSCELFFRFWTAKEAVLKATGVGISGLLKCNIVEIPDNLHLILNYQNRLWVVEHHFFDGHIATVVKNDFDIQWVKPSYFNH